MIQITPQMRVLVAIEPVDGRKGIDSLAQLCQQKLYEAQLLLAAGDVSRVRAAPVWRRVNEPK
jgi:hypothetical protein